MSFLLVVVAAVGRGVGTDAGRIGSAEPGGSGKEERIDWLVVSYSHLVFRVAFAITRNEALAEEVVQDTMFKAWTSMPSWDEDVPVRWLRTVARNRAISVMRKEGRSGAEDNWETRSAPEHDTERVVEGRGLVEAMYAALATLDEEARTMIVLRETDDLGYDEIAELLDMTPAAVKAKLYRARHQLKELLREWGL